jgi:hypothetical protein
MDRQIAMTTRSYERNDLNEPSLTRLPDAATRPADLRAATGSRDDLA